MKSSISMDSVVSRSAQALAAEVGGEVVLMSVERGRYYGFDMIASDVWRRIEQPMSMAALVASLTQAYEGDPEQIAADASDLLGQLQEHGLVEIASGSH